MTVVTGKPVSARVSGSPEALERVLVRVEGRTLLVRPNLSGWGGYPGKQGASATVTLATPDLETAIVLGSGSLTVDRMKARRVVVTVEGSGRAAIGRIDADYASLAIAGSGTIEAGGRAAQTAVVVRGSASLRAPDLAVADLNVISESAGNVAMQASRSAKVSAQGVGGIEVTGTASCEVRQVGPGPVRCGK